MLINKINKQMFGNKQLKLTIMINKIDNKYIFDFKIFNNNLCVSFIFTILKYNIYNIIFNYNRFGQ